MNFFISDALAQSGESTGGGLISLIPLVLIFVLFYFLLIRPQQKRTKNHKAMVAALQVGDEVVTNGGTIGKIFDLDDNFIQLEVANSVIVQVQRHAVQHLMPDGTFNPQFRKKSKASKRKAKSQQESD